MPLRIFFRAETDKRPSLLVPGLSVDAGEEEFRAAASMDLFSAGVFILIILISAVAGFSRINQTFKKRPFWTLIILLSTSNKCQR